MTLVETLIAVAIFSIVMFITLSTFTSFNNLKTSSDTIINTSQQARSIFEKITRDLRELDKLNSLTPASIDFTLKDTSGRSGYSQRIYEFDNSTKKLYETAIFYQLNTTTGTYYNDPPTNSSQTVLTQETNILNQGNLAINIFSLEANANGIHPNLVKITIKFNQEGTKVQEKFSQTLESYVFLSNKSN